jgi:SAM-dependent methyltransferase
MFEEAGRIGPSLEALVKGGVCGPELELVLVDDGSSDGTAEVAEATLARLGVERSRVLRLEANRGKGVAVRAGMLAAGGAVRAFVDADLCVDAEDIERCFALLEGGADVVYGTRAHPESSLEANQPAYRVLSGRTFNALLRLLGLTAERDTQCGLKGATAEAVGEVFEPLVTERFAFDVEVLARAARSGLRVEPLAVSWSHVPASRVRPVRDGLDMARAAVRIRRILDHEARGARETTAGGAGPGTTMAAEAIEAMARVEREHWWFRAKHQLVLDALDHHAVAGLVVDVGAGTGGLLERLAVAGRPAVGAELDPLALSLARQGISSAPLVRAVAEGVPIASGAADAVTCLDVVEHLDDDVAGLRELARVAGPGGLVVVMVPAHRWAWSEHDVRLGHRRRYERPDLCAAATEAGLDVLRCTHVHSWLVPPALLVRRTPVRRLLRGSAEEASMGHPLVNRALRALTVLERLVVARRDLPLGLSILLVARVPSCAAPART